jgi:hypothetical protein
MKRRQKTILKSLDKVMTEAKNGKHQEQQQIQRLKKVHLEKDEFTENKTIENALVTFAVEARQLEDHYQGHRKRMIQTVALALEDELNRIGKPELVCHISEELTKILKQTGVRWNAIYLRRCLDERYKDPTNRMNALARKQHPGVPQDTGLTAEQLQEQLNRKPSPGWGQEYTVKTTTEYAKVLSKHAFSKAGGLALAKEGILVIEAVDEKTLKLIVRLPIIARVRPAEQDVILEIDNDTLEENKVKNKPMD